MPSTQPEAIAIVGSGCRFPGAASSPSALWKLLESPRDVGMEIPPDRFDASAFFHPDGSHHGTSNVLRSYLLEEDVRAFDAAFFNISPNEADSMDPQQRILLETVYEALEAGGHTVESLRGSDTAVYAGTMTADYNDTLTRDHNTMPNYFATGTNRAIISNRVSYFFDWHGPSMTIDTACSSSLVALHQGVRTLRASESRVAVACGTQVLLNPEMYIGESKLTMLSPNGRCRMWDADADGYARGEGVAAVVLKRLSDAIEDGDHIECIVRETGANQDGFSNGLTVPNSNAQSALIRQTYKRAGLDPANNPQDRPQFFEAHGTGTQAGDPKEAAAIHECFGRHITDSENPLYVGSIKTIIGHLEGCAGLAGVLKASSMIQAGSFAPNLLFETLNPKIEPFYNGLHVPTKLTPWPTLEEGVPRRVSVNSFGFGGTNSHAILESYEAPTITGSSGPTLTPFVFSAASEGSLLAQLQFFSEHLKTHHDTIDISDLAWTLHSRRSQLSTKAAFSALTVEQLASKIDIKLAEVTQNSATAVGLRSSTKTAPRLLGVFTGQGAQWPAMGAHLIRSSEFVQKRIQELEDSLNTLPVGDRPAWSLKEEMLAGADTSRLAEAALSQPLCTAIQVALIDLLRAAGITFSAVVGHSSGEIAAAYAADFISGHDAIRLAYYRGFFAHLAGNEATGQKGAMLAVGTSWEDAQDFINLSTFKGRLTIAAHNSPASVTLSGDADAVVHAKKVFDEDRKFARALKVDTAYHSHHMLPCGEAYVKALQACGIRINRERSKACSWFSSVTASAEPMEPIDDLLDVYWRDNMTNAVLFADAVKNAAASDELINLAIEVGPHPALKGPAMQNISEVRDTPIPYTGVLSRGKNDIEAFSEGLGFMWTHLPQLVDFQAFEKAVAAEGSRPPKLVAGLPSYQWNHGRSHWSESRISRKMRTRKHGHHEILGFLSTDSNAQELRWLNVLKQSEIPWLTGHQLQGMTVFPAAGYIAMALEASRHVAGNRQVKLFELHDLSIPRALTFEDGDNAGVETLVTLTGVKYLPDQTATTQFACYSVPVLTKGSDLDMELMASGTVKIIFGIPDVAALDRLPVTENNMAAIDPDRFYAGLAELGYNYGGPFRTMSGMKRKLNQSSVLVDSFPYKDSDVSDFLVHPSTLDVAFQASILAFSAPGDGRLGSLSVPVGMKALRVNPEVCASLPTSGSKVPVISALDPEFEGFSASIDLLDQDAGNCMIHVEDIVLQPFAPATAADDSVMFTNTKFGFALPDGGAATNLSSMVAQVTHRYPHARILEIGAGAGAATKSILQSIGGKYSSYNYTDASEDYFARASEFFIAHSDKMIFSPLDIEKPPTDQGYEPRSYDIIIASNALSAANPLHTALKNVRELLKPGGYLLLSEPTSASAVGTISEGQSDGRTASSPLTLGIWHSALRKAGFGGVDAATPDMDRADGSFSVMASQAVDDRVHFLRRPLSASTPPIHIESLVILGNGTLETVRLGEEVVDHLGRFCGETTILNGLPTEEEALELNPMSTFVNLVDIDSAIFRDMTPEKMDGLKRMVELAKHIVWVTQGAHTDHAYHMASVGFSRTVQQEAAHITWNLLDVSDLQHNTSKAISEYLLQQSALDAWEAPPSALGDREHRDFAFLWSKEPEVFLDHGKLKIPRLMVNTAQNARLNSSKRVITKTVPISHPNITVISPAADVPSSLVELVGGKPKEFSEDFIKVEASTLMAVRVTPDMFLYVGAGRGKDGKLQVFVSTTNSSQAAPVASVPADVEADADDLLVSVASELIVSSLLDQIPNRSHMLVHCSGEDRFLAAALTKQAAARAVGVEFTCDGQDKQRDPAWITLDVRTPNHCVRERLRQIMPTHFLDLTATPSLSESGLRVDKFLPARCSRINPTSLYRHQSSALSQSYDHAALERLLKDAVSRTVVFPGGVQDLVTQVDRVSALSYKHATYAVHWPVYGFVEIEVRPLEAEALFSKDKTYILVGLSGSMGQSLCEWMVSNGAGCVCLTSRRPKVDEDWLKSFRGTGATIKVVPMDVLDKENLQRAVDEIRATCPPIAGIANGAMILEDQLFSNMSAESMQRVLGPKIDGSKNLDEIFYNEDLEFFVMFSSIACVFGNVGQSNYNAANAFMGGLARQRRRRGLAASALDIGQVTGIGLIEAANQSVHDQLRKLRLALVSETVLRKALGEAIQAGYPGQNDYDYIPTVTTGVRIYGDDEKDEVTGPWFSNSFFSHMIRQSDTSSSGADEQDKKSLPVRQQLPTATSKQEALEILEDCLAARLRVLLQLGDQEIHHDAPLLELGIDSLVAVEVRTWFTKELKVDMPVLKVIGGASLAELCQGAFEKLPAELAASIGSEGKDAEPTKPATTAPQPQLPQPRVEGSVSDSTSSSGDNSTSTPGENSTPDKQAATTLTTMTTPSVVSDHDSPETAKQAASLGRKFLKSERLSLPQSRFWFLRHLLEDPTTPNVVFQFHVTGNLHVGALERAIRTVTTRHEALRTCFVENENEAGEAYQKVLRSSPMRLERKKVASEEEVAAEYKTLKEHVFDLENGDVMRILLLTLSSGNHHLLINYHHIVMDGASFNIFTADLEKAYSGQSLGAPPGQYPAFSVAQRQALEKGEMSDELTYWQGVFPAGEQPPVLPLLPMARTSSRVAMKGFAAHQVAINLEPELVARVKAVSKAQRSTPFHFHLAAFKAMLFCLAGEQTKDLTIGIADAARNDSSVEGSIGFFLNLLTLRFRRQNDQTFADAVSEARDTTYAALGTSRLPFDVLLTELGIARSSLHSPFFQAFLDYRQGAQQKYPWGNCEFEFQDVHPGRTAYDITLDVTEWNATDTLVMIRVQTSLYDLTAANLLLKTYVNFLETVTSDASLTLEATPIFGQEQLTKAVEVGRGESTFHPLRSVPKKENTTNSETGLNLTSDWPGTLPLRIDQIAEEHPRKVALMDGTGKVLTYSGMVNRIEAISEALQNSGVHEGSRVLVYQQPAADWTCSMLAIMRIGAVYVPLDLRNPLRRLATVAKNCEPLAILADDTTNVDALQLQAEAPESSIINVSGLPEAAAAHIPNVSDAESTAAILYTSGSTGLPKGIVVTHAGLRNEIEGYTKSWGLGAERALQQSAFTFNHSSDQMYTALCNGGMAYIVPADKRGDPISITKIIQEQGITYTKATPSEYSLWMQYGGDTLRQANNWRFAFGGGEQLTTLVTQEFASLNLPQLRFFNSYGPTEISISSHKMEIPYRETEKLVDMGRIPCGFSLPNYFTYVVDEQLRPVPVGMPGEICLGGAGVSRGYLKNEELTDKHFVTNPFATSEDIARGWTRMYRTGDIGHLQEDGAMVFHSRMAGDAQVKIRGLRIELSDIESNMICVADGALREVVVTLREGDSPFLVAHVVFEPKHNVADKDAFLRDLLARLSLPQYMIPVMAIPLDKFPLSNHSKVDRKAVQAMPLPDRVLQTQDDTELTETMVQLRHVWREVLGKNVDKLGLDLGPSTDFFIVGGNSLLVIRLQACIRQAFNVALPLAKLLGASVLGDMARKIEESPTVDPIDWEQETTPPTVPTFLRDLAPKTPATAKTVLVTGATGFLGQSMLPQLAARSDVAAIHCVAVRDKPRARPLFSASNVAYHPGDLSLPLLGLGLDEFRQLASQVDVILHMGAVRSFWDNYNVLRPSNVHPTKELAKLASVHQVPIHYISTVGVLPELSMTNDAGSAAAFVPPADGTEGYVGSKWASERILERSAEELDVPSSIYRFLPATQQDPVEKQRLMDAFIHYVDASSKVPDMSVWAGRVDLIPTEQVSQWLGDSVTAAPATTAMTKFSHYESPLAVHTDELSAYIQQERGDREGLESMPVLKWFGLIKSLGFDYLLASQEATVGGSGENGQVLQSRR
ncbi:Acyl transferase/acyl hydrolase/lysophospholipase [Penicillium concentricum]|uniref:Acyl transferase/acyl hydrolase/lysophospholipase n=1 Tax=Penicillium concentricum TaxID=293559 RepID=A0A9W9SS04_9EURO|nr:Acyl transferase/acyl hydrolase/lysophospholipase [Penicillium concentricum]KAJ5382444.1 Acyl transferase/acyl hydrolase/lysophospholipase [Penicillium concentricum]